MPTAAAVDTVAAASVISVAPATIDTTSDQKWIQPRILGLTKAVGRRAERALVTPTRLRDRKFADSVRRAASVRAHGATRASARTGSA
ncbi:hypothetical protein GCM10023108_09950 [Saccharopolyspora hordei]